MAVEKTNSIDNLVDAVDVILDKGFVSNQTESFCCPGCGDCYSWTFDISEGGSVIYEDCCGVQTTATTSGSYCTCIEPIDAVNATVTQDLPLKRCSVTYTLASVETYLKYAEAVGLTQSAAVPALPAELNGAIAYGAVTPFGDTGGGDHPLGFCCRNVAGSVETYLKYAEAVGLTQSAAVPAAIPFGDTFEYQESAGCNNNFSDCLTQLSELLTPSGWEQLLDKGIIEDGTILGDTGLCVIVDFFKSISSIVTPSILLEVMDRILDKGLVINCFEGQMTIASVETYLKYAEAVGLTQSAAVPA